MAENPVLVIGLDGATFDVVRLWAEAGIMPHLSRLLNEGISAPLVSTVPPITGPAWSSFATGNHPGKHGNLDFRIKGKNYSLRPISSNTIRSLKLWEALSQAGKRIGVVNVPVTYPPTPVNGLMVSGMLTPSVDSDFAYPPELKEELLRRWPDYSFAVPWREYEGIGVEGLLDALRYVTQQRKELTLYCLKREAWDFFMTVFVGMDRVQHCLWRFLDPQHPSYTVDLAERYLPLIQDYYKFLDEAVGEVISTARGKANVIIMSDHGFGPLWKEVDLNRWLANEGLLAYHNRRQGLAGRTWHLGRRIARAVPGLQRVFKLSYGKRLKQSIWEATLSNTIDWERTRVYCHAHGGLFINLAGRESQGIVHQYEYEALRDELMERLQGMVDPETGERVVYRVQRREEVYHGPALDWAPDVIVTENDERYFLGFITTPYLRSFEETLWKSGYHRPEGILIATGPGFDSAGELGSASIVDLMPTILYLLNVPIPQDLDGQVLKGMLNKKLLASHPPIFREPDGSEPGEDSHQSEEDDALLVERLRSLGYL
jgi:predicted AlkP superfamily phosphohydrolase/phosphomutase